jgi:inosine/xanthosine triphosphatase
MKIAVGSTTSASKIRAAEAVCARAFPGAQVVAVPVASAVSAQPTSDEETVRGALHRAQEARRLGDAELGIGIEGGVHRDVWGVWMCAWVAVVDRRGREGLSCGVRFQLPPWMASRALSGEELGAMVDAFLGHGNAHEELGAIGLLTQGLVDRQAALEQAVAAALIPFLAPERRQAPL